MESCSVALRAIILTLLAMPTECAEGAADRGGGHDRVVHVFDFDERAEGNLEPLPKYWSPLRPPGFPRFAGGGFDFGVGRSAPPSFHLASRGRHVAFVYLGPDTPVRASSDYRVVAHVKPEHLVHARACLSAFYVNREGYPLLDSLVRSEYLAGGGGDASWRRIELLLPAAPADARTVGLALWVLQESMAEPEPRSPRTIPRNDVRGGAWFDDIVVYRLPRAAIASSSPDNVLSPDGEQYIEPTLTDQDDASLRGVLVLRDMAGRVVERHDVPVEIGEPAEPLRVAVGHLRPGLYAARLDIKAKDDAIMSRELVFARSASRRGSESTVARGFGVCLDAAQRSDPEIELSLLRRLQARSVKIPVWTGRPEPDPGAGELRAVDRFFQALDRDGFMITAVLAGAPNTVAQSRGASAPGVVDLLRGDPEPWRESLAALATPYSGVFHWWQVGADGVDPPVIGEPVASAADQLRKALSLFILNPRLSLPVALDDPWATSQVADAYCLQAHSRASPAEVEEAIRRRENLRLEPVSVYVEPLPADRFERRHRLGDFAWRLAAARHAGATVYAPQPWRARTTPQGVVVEPDETFLVVRTLCDLIGEAEPGPKLNLGNGVEALTFHDRDQSVLVLRDGVAGIAPRRFPVQLGAAEEAVDVEGHPLPLRRGADGRQVVELDGMPVLIPDVERWLVELYAAPRLVPAAVDPGRTSENITLELPNRGGQSLAGAMTLKVPAGWSANPSEVPLSLLPGRAERFEFNLEYPASEPAGRKPVHLDISLPEFDYRIVVPLDMEVLLDDVSVQGLAWVEGDHVIVRQAVTNRAGEALSFRASALAPGRERQNRPIPNLQPGDTQTATYRFARSYELAGRTLRLVLTEANDGPRRHTLELVVP